MRPLESTSSTWQAHRETDTLMDTTRHSIVSSIDNVFILRTDHRYAQNFIEGRQTEESISLFCAFSHQLWWEITPEWETCSSFWHPLSLWCNSQEQRELWEDNVDSSSHFRAQVPMRTDPITNNKKTACIDLNDNNTFLHQLFAPLLTSSQFNKHTFR